MNVRKFASFAVAAAVLSWPVAVLGQESHEDAKAQVEAHEHKHHTKAKEIGGGAAGGAAAGAVVAGPAGAVVGGGIGAATGAIVHHHHKKTKIRHHEESSTPDHPSPR